MTEITEVKPKQPHEDAKVVPVSSGLKKFVREFIPKRLLTLAVLSIFLSVTGFFTVHSYLATISNMFTYRINPIIYIAAGASLIIVFLVVFILLLWQAITSATVFVIVILAIIGFGVLAYRTNARFRAGADRVIPFIHQKADPIFDIVFKANNVIAGIVLLIVLGVIGWNYGQGLYNRVPRYIGGGESASVILIFRPTDDILAFGFPFDTNPNAKLQSEPLELLMELSDGVLVRQPAIQVPVIVRDELLYGIMDVPSSTATPPSSASP